MDEWVRKIKRQAQKQVPEVLEQLHLALTAIGTLRLRDGSTATVAPFLAPSPDEEGQWRSAVDVHLSDGTDLEFTLRNTGWGKALTDAPRRAAGGPRRKQ